MDYEAIAVAQMRAVCSDEGAGGGVFRFWVTFVKQIQENLLRSNRSCDRIAFRSKGTASNLNH